jgi:acetyl esterase/lipase
MRMVIASGVLLLALGCYPARRVPSEAARDAEVSVVPSCPPLTDVHADSVRLDTSVVYREVGGSRLMLDIAQPAGAGPHALLVMVHGGGWRSGDRVSQMRRPMLLLAGLGYAAASVSYRLSDSTTASFPAAVGDVACAVRWLRSHARALAIDPGRVAIVGESAGGELAALVGLGAVPRDAAPACDAGDAADDRDAPLRGIIGLYGVYDLRATLPDYPRVSSAIEQYLGARPESVPDRARQASPVARVRPGAPPVLLLHGTADRSVPVEQARAMRDALRRHGVPVTLVELAGQDHAFGFLTEGPAVDPARCTALAFLATVLSRSR